MKERYFVYECLVAEEQIDELKNHLSMNGYDFSVSEEDGVEIAVHEEEMDYVETIMDDRDIDYRIVDIEWK